jgi:hypothetical protein
MPTTTKSDQERQPSHDFIEQDVKEAEAVSGRKTHDQLIKLFSSLPRSWQQDTLTHLQRVVKEQRRTDWPIDDLRRSYAKWRAWDRA